MPHRRIDYYSILVHFVPSDQLYLLISQHKFFCGAYQDQAFHIPFASRGSIFEISTQPFSSLLKSAIAIIGLNITFPSSSPTSTSSPSFSPAFYIMFCGMGSLPSSNFAFIMSAPYLVYVHPLNKISLERTVAWRSAFRKYRKRALWCMRHNRRITA